MKAPVELPAASRWAMHHPVWCGIASGAVMFVVGVFAGFWLWVSLGSALVVGGLNWFLFTHHGGPVRRSIERTYGYRDRP